MTNDTNLPSLVGRKVPPFTANAVTGSQTHGFSLSEQLGSAVVLYFYPKDNTPGCTQEAAEFRDAHSLFTAAGAKVVGVSRDSLKSHQSFISKLELPFTLISDPDESLCNMFGVMKTKNMYGKQVIGIERSTFLIDRQGVVAREWRGVKVADHVNQVLAAAKAL